MNYTLAFDKQPLDFVENLPKEIGTRILNKLADTKPNPYHFFRRLTGRTDYRLRVGDYRIIADIDDGSRVIHVTMAAHRKNVYE